MGLCKIVGLKVVVGIKEDIVAGFNYLIKINNIRNPEMIDRGSSK